MKICSSLTRILFFLLPLLTVPAAKAAVTKDGPAVAEQDAGTIIVPVGVTAGVVQRAITQAAMERGWTVKEKAPGRVVLFLEQGGWRSLLTFTSDEKEIKISSQSGQPDRSGVVTKPAVPERWVNYLKQDISKILASKPSSPSSALADGASPRLRLRIAIDQFKWNELRQERGEITRDVREGLQATLIEKLKDSGHFIVMERELTALNQASVETRFDEAKRTDADVKAMNLRPRQKITAARFIITPTVTGMEQSSSGENSKGFSVFNRNDKEVKMLFSVNLRISDAETSVIVESCPGSRERIFKESSNNFEIGGFSFGNKKGTGTPFSLVVNDALDDAVEKVVKRLSNEPWSAEVADFDPDARQIAISAGTDEGVAVGMQLDVFSLGRVIRNPSTGDIISRGRETKIGRVKVVGAERGAAFCDVLEGKDFAPRNVVRLSAR